MKKTALIILGLVASFCLGFFFKTIITKQPTNNIAINQQDDNIKIKKRENMKLGAFSVSLSVKCEPQIPMAIG